VARVGPARLGLLLPEQAAGLQDEQELRALSQRLREQVGVGTFKIRDTPQSVRLLLGAVTYRQAPLFGLKGVLHEAELAIDVAHRERADHFTTR
jgi:hypothetical protein